LAEKSGWEEIIDEIKALYAQYMPDAWIEVSITSWKEFEFDEQRYGCCVISVDDNFQKHELRCVANNGAFYDLDGHRICGSDLSETGQSIHEGLTRLLESSRHLLAQDISIMEYS
jgi:hypothetical protein